MTIITSVWGREMSSMILQVDTATVRTYFMKVKPTHSSSCSMSVPIFRVVQAVFTNTIQAEANQSLHFLATGPRIWCWVLLPDWSSVGERLGGGKEYETARRFVF